MRRRAFLAAVSSCLGLSVAGCVDSAPSGDDVPTFDYSSLDMVAASETPDEPAITEVEADWPVAEVTIEGTATVQSDCSRVVLDSEPAIVEDGRVAKVVLGTRVVGDSCVQAQRDVGYRLLVAYEGACPRVIRLAEPGKTSVELAVNCP